MRFPPASVAVRPVGAVGGSVSVVVAVASLLRDRAVSYVPSPIFHEGHFYSILDGGEILCIEAKTGETVWDHRIKGRFRTSLLLINENLYITNDRGTTTIFKATTTGFKKVAVNDLEEFCYTTPAVSAGKLFIRTKSLLYCIGKR